MTSVSILSLKSSPINLMFPIERLLAWSLASCSSSMSRCFSSSCHKSKRWVKKKKKRNGWGGLAFHFLWCRTIPLKLLPALSASSQRSHRHLYPFQTPSGIDLAAACGNSQWVLVYLRFLLEAEKTEKIYIYIYLWWLVTLLQKEMSTSQEVVKNDCCHVLMISLHCLKIFWRSIWLFKKKNWVWKMSRTMGIF